MTLFDIAAPEWLDHAACSGYEPEWWFPSKGDNQRVARAICASCPVQSECLEEALRLARSGHTVCGVWGGTTEKERARLKGRDRYCPDCGGPTRFTGNGRLARCDDCRVKRKAEKNARYESRRAS